MNQDGALSVEDDIGAYTISFSEFMNWQSLQSLNSKTVYLRWDLLLDKRKVPSYIRAVKHNKSGIETHEAAPYRFEQSVQVTQIKWGEGAPASANIEKLLRHICAEFMLFWAQSGDGSSLPLGYYRRFLY